MTDTGWEQWTDVRDIPLREQSEMADACIEHLQRKPSASFKLRTYGGKLFLAVRGDDGTIWSWQADIRAERLIYADV
jgi:hypothetical protein